MRHATMAGLVLLMFIAGTARVDAGTVQVTLTVLGSRDINVAVAGPPFDEFHAQRSSWGTVTFNGTLIGYFVLSTEDKMHVGNQGSYPAFGCRSSFARSAPHRRSSCFVASASPRAFAAASRWQPARSPFYAERNLVWPRTFSLSHVLN